MPTYQLSSYIYLDQIHECYKKIVIINQKPTGALQPLIKMIHSPKVSPFKMTSPCCPEPYCILAILNPLSTNELLCMDQIGDLFSFLISNGYTIQYELTKIMQLSTQKIDKLICYISN